MHRYIRYTIWNFDSAGCDSVGTVHCVYLSDMWFPPESIQVIQGDSSFSMCYNRLINAKFVSPIWIQKAMGVFYEHQLKITLSWWERKSLFPFWHTINTISDLLIIAGSISKIFLDFFVTWMLLSMQWSQLDVASIMLQLGIWWECTSQGPPWYCSSMPSNSHAQIHFVL